MLSVPDASPLSIPFIVLSFLLAFLIPVGFYFYMRKKYHISVKPVLIGAAVWFISTEILEQTVHFFVLRYTPILQYPLLFSAYGALLAGIFEELGRYIAYKQFLPKFREWKDGVAYGIGHGGIESILIGLVVIIQTFALISMMANKQLLPSNIQDTINTIHVGLTSQPYIFLFSGIERIMAFTIQIGLSLVVLLAVKRQKISLLFLAIGLHAFFDFAPALYQTHVLAIMPTEFVIFIFAVISFYWIVKSQRLFEK